MAQGNPKAFILMTTENVFFKYNKFIIYNSYISFYSEKQNTSQTINSINKLMILTV